MGSFCQICYFTESTKIVHLWCFPPDEFVHLRILIEGSPFITLNVSVITRAKASLEVARFGEGDLSIPSGTENTGAAGGVGGDSSSPWGQREQLHKD